MSYQFQLLPELAATEYDALKADIAQNGVLVPVEVDEHGTLLDGHHRVRAWKELTEEGVKLPPYPSIVRRFHNDDEKVEHALKINLMRRHLDRGQLVTLAKDLRGRGEYWTLKKVGETLGVHLTTVWAWVPPSELENPNSEENPVVINSRGQQRPAAYKPRAASSTIAMNPMETERALLAMEDFDEPEDDDDEGEFVNTSTGELQTTTQRRQKAAQREREYRNADLAKTSNAPMPNGKYRCIVIDPPWPMKKINRDERPDQGTSLDYPVMSLDEITALPVADIADPDGCHIYLWVTQKYLPAGIEMLKAWGFAYQCVMTWVKPTGMTPYSWMYNTEHVLFGRMGSLDLQRMGLKLSFDASVTRHSAKPEVFYERVLSATPGPRIELFSRADREGFIAWGNEARDGAA